MFVTAPIAATPKSRVLSVIGIARKRSNATSKEEKSARSSFNSQTSLIRESSPDTATPPRGLNGGGSGQSKQDQQRLCVVGSGGSRPSSGQFLLTSTPNHSRYNQIDIRKLEANFLFGFIHAWMLNISILFTSTHVTLL